MENLQAISSLAPSLVPTAACSFWSARLNFTAPVSARHFCLLGQNRYTAPEVIGACNNETISSGICRKCLSLDGSTERNCTYLEGIGDELGMIPPVSGYDDFSCPVGYENYTDVLTMNLECPVDSVLLLELLSSAGQHYDFNVTTPFRVTRKFESAQCLTGIGGRDCGDDALTMFAYDKKGSCSLNFTSGLGYQAYCKQEGNSLLDFLGNVEKQTCFVENGLLCSQLSSIVSTNNTTGVGGSAGGSTTEEDLFCSMDDWASLDNPVALLVGAGVMLLTLVPGFLYFRVGYISPSFLVGLLSEAVKNGGVLTTVFSIDWKCLRGNGIVVPTGPGSVYAVFLPYALIAFSLTDTVLAIIALVANWGKDMEESFDQFKWTVEEYKSLPRKIMTFLTLVIFGGFGGFMQLGLILDGIVDADNENGVSDWASWMFIVSASLGAFLGVSFVLYGVYAGNMRMAWKFYKLLVGDLCGIITSVEIAPVLLIGWGIETLNDILHLLLYIPTIMHSK